MEHKYLNFDDTKIPPYYNFVGGRGNGRTFFQSLNEVRNKVINAKYEDPYYDERNYTWLIGEYEIIPTNNKSTLFGIKVVFIPGTGIRLYKEV